MPFGLTTHVIEAYRIHHPDAEDADVHAALETGVKVEEMLGRTLVGRPWKNKKHREATTYILAPDRCGIFAVADDTAITYLRFQMSQQNFAMKHWPIPGSEPEPEPIPEPEPPRRVTTDEKKRHSVLDWMDARLVQAPREQVVTFDDARRDYLTWVSDNERKAAKLELWTATMGERYLLVNSKVFEGVGFVNAPVVAPVVVTPPKPPPPPAPPPPSPKPPHDEPTKEQVYDHELPGTRTILRHVRILPDLGSWAGSAVRARRLLFTGSAGDPPNGNEQLRWCVRRQDGVETDVLLFKAEGPKGPEWHAGLTSDSPPPSASRRCSHCGEAVEHQYEVADAVRAEARAVGDLHIWCLEQRLGRDLTLVDLSDSSVNDPILFGFRMARQAQGHEGLDGPSPFLNAPVNAMLRAWLTARVRPDEASRVGVLAAFEDYERFCRALGRAALPLPSFRSQVRALLGDPVRENDVFRYRAAFLNG